MKEFKPEKYILIKVAGERTAITAQEMSGADMAYAFVSIVKFILDEYGGKEEDMKRLIDNVADLIEGRANENGK